MRKHVGVLVSSILALAGCGASPPAFPRVAAPVPEPDLVLVWVGAGEAERMEGGAWRRTPDLDYEFSVEQRRYGTRWESIKSIRWRRPGYDGGAGAREQTWFFELQLRPANEGQVAATVHSSLGEGAGKSDHEFREATYELHANVSAFAPFDAYRITQHYGYEQGQLEETVELVKHDGQGEHVWVRNHERARLFAPQSFKEAPTRF